VWVIAETLTGLPTPFRKIVVTDDQGRYVLPDLPKAAYQLFVRGYGLVDSPRVSAAPGRLLNLTAVIAPTAAAAAEYYPPNYWWSLMTVPAASEFPGTGADGNGILPGMRSQSDWIGTVKNNCMSCHQIGNKATREIPRSLGTFKSTFDAWSQRIVSGQAGPTMNSFSSRFGRSRLLKVFADWTDRIAAGELPPVPPRPQGRERDVVISLWDWADQYAFVHDTISTDKRRPTINAHGPVYSVGRFNAPDINVLDPQTGRVSGLTAPIRDADTPFTMPQAMAFPSPYWGKQIIWTGKASIHNPMMDHKGRVWSTHQFRDPNKNPAYCTSPDHPSAKLFPLEKVTTQLRELSYYDPTSRKWTLIDTCFGTHHLQFAEDANHTLWLSGDGQVIGWVNTKMFDDTGDAAKSQGWSAFVLDTNGNGRRDAYVEPDQPVDPAKDKRIRGGSYGIIPSPVDGSVWVAQNVGFPGVIIRVVPGANPPATTLSEVYEVPFDKGYIPRGIDIDRNGLVWVSLAGSGHLASFDRRKCGVLNGPTATGRHCPEGWTMYLTPGPKFKGAADQANANANMLYYNWTDQFDVFGLGANTPFATGTGSESLLALTADRTFLDFRVPYPMGFYHRGLDGRIDDAKAGWKGRGLWANYGMYTPWHQEGGKGALSKAVKFQLRPDPLAH
jgi:hypothetical protein